MVDGAVADGNPWPRGQRSDYGSVAPDGYAVAPAEGDSHRPFGAGMAGIPDRGRRSDGLVDWCPAGPLRCVAATGGFRAQIKKESGCICRLCGLGCSCPGIGVG